MSRHVLTCSHQSLSCLSTVEVQGMSFSQVQRVFIVEHYLASRSYFTCPDEFRDTFPDSPVPNKSIIPRLVSVTQEACRTETVPVDLRC
jgi:hypothetical protein